MKKLILAALAAGAVVSFAPAASAASYQQSLDLYAEELGGLGVVSRWQIERELAARGVRRPQPTNATRATFRPAEPITRNDMNLN